jgi:hypothetical protein
MDGGYEWICVVPPKAIGYYSLLITNDPSGIDMYICNFIYIHVYIYIHGYIHVYMHIHSSIYETHLWKCTH